MVKVEVKEFIKETELTITLGPVYAGVTLSDLFSPRDNLMQLMKMVDLLKSLMEREKLV